MANFVGTYKLESQENYKEYLMSLGLDEEKAAKLSEVKEDAVISAVDADSVTAEYGSKSVKFPLNKEHEHELRTGYKVWTTVVVTADNITFKTKLSPDGAVSEEKSLKLVGDVLTVTSTNTKGAKAVRKYKKI